METIDKIETSLIKKYVKDLSNNDVLVLFLHYQRVIDDVKLNTLNDCVWFFVLKDEKHRRKSDQS
tara:strand:+ start:630 stop:824 length:195 start_codon:yes stop_codon:yes gene_type:complete